MSVRIIIDMFSGRPNPTIELADADLPGKLTLPTIRRSLSESATDAGPRGILGYRGVLVEESNPRSKSFGRRYVVEDHAAISDLLSKAGKRHLAEAAFDMQPTSQTPKLRRALKSFREFLAEQESHSSGKAKPSAACKCAPLYEPVWWNDAGQHQFNNNCYNYATNYRSDTFAQPELAAGQQYTSLDCAAVHTAALADDLIDTPLENLCPPEGHLVALVVAPGIDFHWYRLGRDGHWTHKPGGTAVTNLDNSGNVIVDPRTADRGPYTDFCHFMVVMHGHTKIQ